MNVLSIFINSISQTEYLLTYLQVIQLKCAKNMRHKEKEHCFQEERSGYTVSDNRTYKLNNIGSISSSVHECTPTNEILKVIQGQLDDILHDTLFYEVHHNDNDNEKEVGEVSRVSQFLINATNMQGVAVYEMVRVGAEQLLGEVLDVDGDTAKIKLFESGLQIGDPVVRTRKPLMVELGPGILGQIYDGIQRPFKEMSEGGTQMYLPRGANTVPLDRKKLWEFIPQNFKIGDHITGGDVFGKVYETALVVHWIMLPPKAKGTIVFIVPTGHYNVTEEVLTIEFMGSHHSFTMMHRWPVRQPRPCAERLSFDTPLYTGRRVLDALFPLAQGGTCAIPGAFGCGKGVLCQSIAKYSNSDVLVYVVCGERGNDLAEVIMESSHTTIELAGVQHEIMKRMCVVGSTSDMPVGLREASIYTGVTVAEYFRDQGYNSTLMADSTSRWMEALREAGYRLNRTLSESGYPSYYGARLASFYERAGKVTCIGSPSRSGSLSIITSVSPHGGDFAEPITRATLSIVKAFWALDKKIAQRRYFPAVNYNISHSSHARSLRPFFETLDPEYLTSLYKLKELLQQDNELIEIVQLVGNESLAESDKLTVAVAELIREDFLGQDVFTHYDRECPFYKTVWMMKNVVTFYELARRVVERDLTTRDLMHSMEPVLYALRMMKYQDPARDGRAAVEEHMKEVYAKILHSFCIFNHNTCEY